MQNRDGVAVANPALLVDQVNPQQMRKLARGMALRVHFPVHGLLIVTQDRLQLGLRARGQKMPVDAARLKTLAVLCHHRRRVMRGIETQRDQPQAVLQLRTGCQCRLDAMQHHRRQRAAIGIVAGRINEAQQHHAARIHLVQRGRLTARLQHLPVGRLAQTRQVVTTRLGRRIGQCAIARGQINCTISLSPKRNSNQGEQDYKPGREINSRLGLSWDPGIGLHFSDTAARPCARTGQAEFTVP